MRVQARAEPRQSAEVVGNDLKACNDETSKLGFSWGGKGVDQFVQCMGPRGYSVTVIR